jgi:hypothetical protein
MSGYYYGKKSVKDKIVIKEVKVSETKYVKVPKTMDEAIKCYKSPIRIEAKTVDNTIEVKAYDDCKEATANINIESSNDNKCCLYCIGTAIGTVVVIVILHAIL